MTQKPLTRGLPLDKSEWTREERARSIADTCLMFGLPLRRLTVQDFYKKYTKRGRCANLVAEAVFRNADEIQADLTDAEIAAACR